MTRQNGLREESEDQRKGRSVVHRLPFVVPAHGARPRSGDPGDAEDDSPHGEVLDLPGSGGGPGEPGQKRKEIGAESTEDSPPIVLRLAESHRAQGRNRLEDASRASRSAGMDSAST